MFLLVLLASVGDGWAAPTTASDTHIVKAEKTGSQSTNPFNQPNLFNIYHQAEHAGNSSSNIPVPHLVVDEHDQSVAYRSAKLNRDQQEEVWLKIFEIPNRTFLRLSFIFPFHSFL
jgi:hypothetical protein